MVRARARGSRFGAVRMQAGSVGAGRRLGRPGGRCWRRVRRRPPPQHDDDRRPDRGRPIPASAFSDHTGVTAELGHRRQRLDPRRTGSSRVRRSEPRPTPTTSTPAVAWTAARSSSTPATTSSRGPRTSRRPRPPSRRTSRLVGSFSLEDSYGATAIAANPTVSNVSVALSQKASDLPNTFSVNPVRFGWGLGGLAYFKNLYPDRHHPHRGHRLQRARRPRQTWTAEQAGHGQPRLRGRRRPHLHRHPVGLHPGRHRHEERRGEDPVHRAAAAELRGCGGPGASIQQNYHPVVVLGAAGYSEAFVPSRRAAPPTPTASGSIRARRSTSARTPPCCRPIRPSSTGSRWRAPASSPTCTRCTGGSPPNCSCRR